MAAQWQALREARRAFAEGVRQSKDLSYQVRYGCFSNILLSKHVIQLSPEAGLRCIVSCRALLANLETATTYLWHFAENDLKLFAKLHAKAQPNIEVFPEVVQKGLLQVWGQLCGYQPDLLHAPWQTVVEVLQIERGCEEASHSYPARQWQTVVDREGTAIFSLIVNDVLAINGSTISDLGDVPQAISAIIAMLASVSVDRHDYHPSIDVTIHVLNLIRTVPNLFLFKHVGRIHDLVEHGFFKLCGHNGERCDTFASCLNEVLQRSTELLNEGILFRLFLHVFADSEHDRSLNITTSEAGKRFISIASIVDAENASFLVNAFSQSHMVQIFGWPVILADPKSARHSVEQLLATSSAVDRVFIEKRLLPLRRLPGLTKVPISQLMDLLRLLVAAPEDRCCLDRLLYMRNCQESECLTPMVVEVLILCLAPSRGTVCIMRHAFQLLRAWLDRRSILELQVSDIINAAECLLPLSQSNSSLPIDNLIDIVFSARLDLDMASATQYILKLSDILLSNADGPEMHRWYWHSALEVGHRAVVKSLEEFEFYIRSCQHLQKIKKTIRYLPIPLTRNADTNSVHAWREMFEQSCLQAEDLNSRWSRLHCCIRKAALSHAGICRQLDSSDEYSDPLDFMEDFKLKPHGSANSDPLIFLEALQPHGEVITSELLALAWKLTIRKFNGQIDASELALLVRTWPEYQALTQGPCQQIAFSLSLSCDIPLAVWCARTLDSEPPNVCKMALYFVRRFGGREWTENCAVSLRRIAVMASSMCSPVPFVRVVFGARDHLFEFSDGDDDVCFKTSCGKFQLIQTSSGYWQVKNTSGMEHQSSTAALSPQTAQWNDIFVLDAVQAAIVSLCFRDERSISYQSLFGGDGCVSKKRKLSLLERWEAAATLVELFQKAFERASAARQINSFYRLAGPILRWHWHSVDEDAMSRCITVLGRCPMQTGALCSLQWLLSLHDTVDPALLCRATTLVTDLAEQSKLTQDGVLMSCCAVFQWARHAWDKLCEDIRKKHDVKSHPGYVCGSTLNAKFRAEIFHWLEVVVGCSRLCKVEAQLAEHIEEVFASARHRHDNARPPAEDSANAGHRFVTLILALIRRKKDGVGESLELAVAIMKLCASRRQELCICVQEDTAQHFVTAFDSLITFAAMIGCPAEAQGDCHVHQITDLVPTFQQERWEHAAIFLEQVAFELNTHCQPKGKTAWQFFYGDFGALSRFLRTCLEPVGCSPNSWQVNLQIFRWCLSSDLSLHSFDDLLYYVGSELRDMPPESQLEIVHVIIDFLPGCHNPEDCFSFLFEYATIAPQKCHAASDLQTLLPLLDRASIVFGQHRIEYLIDSQIFSGSSDRQSNLKSKLRCCFLDVLQVLNKIPLSHLKAATEKAKLVLNCGHISGHPCQKDPLIFCMIKLSCQEHGLVEARGLGVALQTSLDYVKDLESMISSLPAGENHSCNNLLWSLIWQIEDSGCLSATPLRREGVEAFTTWLKCFRSASPACHPGEVTAKVLALILWLPDLYYDFDLLGQLCLLWVDSDAFRSENRRVLWMLDGTLKFNNRCFYYSDFNVNMLVWRKLAHGIRSRSIGKVRLRIMSNLVCLCSSGCLERLCEKNGIFDWLVKLPWENCTEDVSSTLHRLFVALVELQSAISASTLTLVDFAGSGVEATDFLKVTEHFEAFAGLANASQKLDSSFPVPQTNLLDQTLLWTVNCNPSLHCRAKTSAGARELLACAALVKNSKQHTLLLNLILVHSNLDKVRFALEQSVVTNLDVAELLRQSEHVSAYEAEIIQWRGSSNASLLSALKAAKAICLSTGSVFEASLLEVVASRLPLVVRASALDAYLQVAHVLGPELKAIQGVLEHLIVELADGGNHASCTDLRDAIVVRMYVRANVKLSLHERWFTRLVNQSHASCKLVSTPHNREFHGHSFLQFAHVPKQLSSSPYWVRWQQLLEEIGTAPTDRSTDAAQELLAASHPCDDSSVVDSIFEKLSQKTRSQFASHIRYLFSDQFDMCRYLHIPLALPPNSAIFRGIGPRDGNALANKAIINLLSRGFGAADLNNCPASGATWAKVGQVFASPSLVTSLFFTDFTSELTALAVINPAHFQRAQVAGRTRVEKEQSFNIVFLDPIPLAALETIWLPEAWRQKLAEVAMAESGALGLSAAETRALQWGLSTLRSKIRFVASTTNAGISDQIRKDMEHMSLATVDDLAAHTLDCLLRCLGHYHNKHVQ